MMIAPTVPAFISATNLATALSLPCLVFIGVALSKALLPKASLISKATVCAFTSWIPVTTKPLLPAFLSWEAAFLTASSIFSGKVPETEPPAT